MVRGSRYTLRIQRVRGTRWQVACLFLDLSKKSEFLDRHFCVLIFLSRHPLRMPSWRTSSILPPRQHLRVAPDIFASHIAVVLPCEVLQPGSRLHRARLDRKTSGRSRWHGDLPSVHGDDETVRPLPSLGTGWVGYSRHTEYFT